MKGNSVLNKSLRLMAVVGLIAAIGYSTSHAQPSCSALIDSIRSKVGIIAKAEGAFMKALNEPDWDKTLPPLCPLAKAAVAASDEVKGLSAEHQRHCKHNTAKRELAGALGWAFEATASRGAFTQKFCQ
jgi:hypothetical protein